MRDTHFSVLEARLADVLRGRGRGSASVIAVTAAAVSLGALSGCSSAAAGDHTSGTVVRVVDGDTVAVKVDDAVRTIRLLNIDAPAAVDPDQPVACLGPEASAKLAEILPVGAKVTVEYDKERAFAGGEDLAAVSREGKPLANVQMVTAGLAVPYKDPANTKFYNEVNKAAKEAQAQHIGLYSVDTRCTMASQLAALQKQKAALAALATPANDGEATALDAKAVALGAATATLVKSLSTKSGFEVADLPTEVLSTYRSAATSVSTYAAGVRTNVVSAKAQIKATAAKKKAEQEAQAKAEAAAKVKAQQDAAAAEAQRAVDAAAAQASADAAAAQAAAASQAAAPPATAPQPLVGGGGGASYANCSAARAAGAAPLYRGQPGYAAKLDRDGDGIACE